MLSTSEMTWSQTHIWKIDTIIVQNTIMFSNTSKLGFQDFITFLIVESVSFYF